MIYKESPPFCRRISPIVDGIISAWARLSVLTKDMIYDMVWGSAIVDENAIMVYINRLRQKIEEDPARPAYIQTVRGLGYRFVV